MHPTATLEGFSLSRFLGKVGRAAQTYGPGIVQAVQSGVQGGGSVSAWTNAGLQFAQGFTPSTAATPASGPFIIPTMPQIPGPSQTAQVSRSGADRTMMIAAAAVAAFLLLRRR